MTSVPLDFRQSLSLEALLSDQAAFGPYNPLQWRSFRYAEVDSELRYVELSETEFTEVHRVSPGKAFWLVSKDTGRIDAAPIAGTSTPTDGPFRVPIPSGWAQIGNPFLFAIDWDSVLVEVRSDTLTMANAESTGHIEPPVAWRVNQGYEVDVRILEPFDGYWVRNPSDTTVCLLIPPREAPVGKARTRTAPTADRTAMAWAIAIRAAAGAVDDANLAGVSPDAATDWDACDRSEPPMSPGESISLYFPHRSWEKHPGLYSIDMRGAFEPLSALRELAPHLPDAEAWGHLWRFDVAKNFAREGAADEVGLEFAGLDGVPEEAIVLLVDRRLETVVDLRKDPSYAFPLRAQSRKLRRGERAVPASRGKHEVQRRPPGRDPGASGPNRSLSGLSQPLQSGDRHSLRHRSCRPGHDRDL